MLITIKNIAGSALFICASGLFYSQNVRAALPIEHWALPNGAQVYLVHSPAVALVDMEVDFDAGSRRDPAAQAGLAGATASMTGKGVRAHGLEPALDENGLDDAWADLGASFDGSASADRMSFTMRSLSDPAILLPAVRLAARQIGEPAYTAPVWAQERARSIAALREADTRPGTLAGKNLCSGGLQRSSVWANSPRPRALPPSRWPTCGHCTTARFDLARRKSVWWAMSIGRARKRAGRSAFVPLACRRLQADATRSSSADIDAAARHPTAVRCALRRRRSISASRAWRAPTPAYFPLLVGNHILGGGGFVSRLTAQVREKRGLSYSVYSSFNPGLNAGAFTIALQPRPDQAAQAVEVVRDVLGGFVADGPTAAELKAAQDNLIGGFPLRIDSDAKLIGNVANIAWNDLPLDYLDTWTEQVRAVTVADIRAAFSRVIQPDRMVSVVVGGTP